ncbi:unnamed protein product [Cyprideis torosa]|uniref:Uncharacterized protein n=1 Tax=Cyprideis torosa TaxID=163714 RepID=A0A7R8WHP0_9CRUS|nr:unnamed protein product [Cyprideis torosa]CAG0899697.1 unnamed protein product [Cyprideis torosa]
MVPQSLLTLLLVFGCVESCFNPSPAKKPRQKRRKVAEPQVVVPPREEETTVEEESELEPEPSRVERSKSRRSRRSASRRKKHKPIGGDVGEEVRREQRSLDRKELESALNEDPDTVRGRMFSWQKFDATRVKRIE